MAQLNNHADAAAVVNETEDIDWGDEEDELELINCTQRLLEENQNSFYNPLIEVVNEDLKNEISERVKHQDEVNVKLQALVSAHGVNGLAGMLSKIKTLEYRNELLQVENYGHQGEISQLRRTMNKLTSSKQMDLLNKLQEDLRIKAEEKEAKSKENAELESLKSKLRFAENELESVRRRMRENQMRMRETTTMGSAPAKAMIDKTISIPLRPLTTATTSRNASFPTWSSTCAKEVTYPYRTKNVCVKEMQTEAQLMLPYYDQEELKHQAQRRKNQSLRHALIQLVQLDLNSVESELGNIFKAIRDELLRINGTLTGWRFADKNNMVWTVMYYLCQLELLAEQAEIIIPKEDIILNFDSFENIDKICAVVLQTNGVWKAVTFAGNEITRLIEYCVSKEDVQEQTCLILFNLLNWVEHLIWAVKTEDAFVENSSGWEAELSEWISQMIEAVWDNLYNRHIFVILRLKCLSIVKAVLVQEFFQPISRIYEKFADILLDTCRRQSYRHYKYLSSVLGILNILASLENERIFSHLCTDSKATEPCLLKALAICALDVFRNETSLSKKMLIFESYTSLARKLHRNLETEIRHLKPEDLVEEGFCTVPPWLASYLWEDKEAKKCQCRKTFCGVGITLLGAVWRFWVVQNKKLSGLLRVNPENDVNEVDDSQIAWKCWKSSSFVMLKHTETTYCADRWSLKSACSEGEAMRRLRENCVNDLQRMMEKFKFIELHKSLTPEQEKWKEDVVKILENWEEEKQNMEVDEETRLTSNQEKRPINIFEEGIYQGVVFLEAISEYTYSLSLAFGTLGFIPFMESIAQYGKFFTQLPLIQQQENLEIVEYLEQLDGDSGERTQNDPAVTDRRPQPPLQIAGEELLSFTDAEWPPKPPKFLRKTRKRRRVDYDQPEWSGDDDEYSKKFVILLKRMQDLDSDDSDLDPTDDEDENLSDTPSSSDEDEYELEMDMEECLPLDEDDVEFSEELLESLFKECLQKEAELSLKKS